MERLKTLARKAEAALFTFLDAQVPALHTAWQVTAGGLVAGLLTVHSTADVKVVVVAFVATFLAALKAYYLKKRS